MKRIGLSMPCSGWRQRSKRLDPAHAAAAQVHLRLVEEHELAALQAAADLAEQHQATGVEAVVLGRVGLGAAALRLGAHERQIGALQQGVHVVGVLAHDGQPDVRLDVQLHAVAGDRLLEALLDFVRDRERLCDVLDAGAQNLVVVGAGTRDDDIVIERGADAPPDLAQHAVAGRGAERVVDLLEAVDVDQQHRDLALGVSRWRTASARRSLNSVRFGRPVSWS